ncbi:hypothetical protein Misp05_33000 [Micromonospora sp. NBRC 107095]|nr:hypothetical protein Misp05_33000 [Micromonospora sp. NBRC 107095]
MRDELCRQFVPDPAGSPGHQGEWSVRDGCGHVLDSFCANPGRTRDGAVVPYRVPRDATPNHIGGGRLPEGGPNDRARPGRIVAGRYWRVGMDNHRGAAPS